MDILNLNEKYVKSGDIIRITPIDKVPNADRILKVDYLTENGVAYGATTTNDSYFMPYGWIKSFRIVKRK